MNEAGPEIVLAMAVVFARVAGVFLIAPGLSSLRVPVQARLFLALALSLAVAPLVYGGALATVRDVAPAALLAVIATETMIGLFIGLLSRLLLMALQTMSVAIANFVGLGGIPSASIDGEEAGAAVSSLFTVTAVTLIFVTNLHYEILRGVVGSYGVLNPGAALDLGDALAGVADHLEEAFMVGLRLASPFLLYSLVVNFAVGIINKLTPQLPVYFVALPLVTAGGLFMMAVGVREVLIAFLDAFDQLLGAL